jgi:hypothetical protein
MYSLAHLLTHAPNGLYRWTPRAESAQHTALFRLKRVQVFRVHGERVHDKRRFLAAWVQAMRLPRWFGMNWDAAADSLTDFDWQPGSAHALLCSKLGGFAQRSPVDFATALAVMEDAARFWEERDVQFWVLIECDRLRQFADLPAVCD